MNSIKLSGYRMGIKFDKDPLPVEQNKYLTQIVNVYIVYDLDAWPKNPAENFKFKNCLFGATSGVRSNDKEKYVIVDTIVQVHRVLIMTLPEML